MFSGNAIWRLLNPIRVLREVLMPLVGKIQRM